MSKLAEFRTRLWTSDKSEDLIRKLMTGQNGDVFWKQHWQFGWNKTREFFDKLSACKHLGTFTYESTLLYYVQFRCTVLSVECLQKQVVLLTYSLIAQENQNNHVLAAECGKVWEWNCFAKERSPSLVLADRYFSCYYNALSLLFSCHCVLKLPGNRCSWFVQQCTVSLKSQR